MKEKILAIPFMLIFVAMLIAMNRLGMDLGL